MYKRQSFAPATWALLAYLFGALALCLLMLGLGRVLGGRSHGRAKNLPFESGVDSTGSSRLRFSVKYALVAMLFVIFGIEMPFLYLWAVSLRENGWAGFVEATLFVSLLLVGLFYLQDVYKRQAIARLDAEVLGKKSIEFPPDVDPEGPLARSERELFKSRRDKLVEGTQAIQRQIHLAQSQLDLVRPLVAKRAVSQMEALKLSPVSYTHLDVYKRQASPSMPSPRRRR